MTKLAHWVLFCGFAAMLSAESVSEDAVIQERAAWALAATSRGFQDAQTLDSDVRERQERVERWQAWPEPEFRFTRAEDVNGDGEPITVGALRLPLPHPWVRKAEKAAWLAELNLAEAEAGEALVEAYARCLATGIRLQYMQADRELLLEQIRLEEAAVQQARTMVDEGMATKPSVTRLQLDLAELKLELQGNRLDYHETLRELSLLTGQPPEMLSGVPVKLDPAALQEMFPLDQLSVSFAPTPLMKAQREQVLARKAAVTAERIPWFEHVQVRAESGNDWGDMDYADVQVAVSLPVFAWFDSGNKLAEETLEALDAYHAFQLEQQRQLQQDRIQELQQALPALVNEAEAFKGLRGELESLKAQELPVREKLDLERMAVRLISLQRELLATQQELELRLWLMAVE